MGGHRIPSTFPTQLLLKCAPGHVPHSSALLGMALSKADLSRQILKASQRQQDTSRTKFVDPMSGKGQTALMVASSGGCLEIVQVLHAQGAKMDVKGDNGFTPLHFAASEGHAHIVKFLVNQGANVHIRDNNGRTPLDVALLKGHSDVVIALNRALARPGVLI